ncbi:MAG: hypothetical protein FJ151_01950, partial [Euryarchaeota archaeon]|nr:hypothetical protein [Euryarchaeota archaeon]
MGALRGFVPLDIGDAQWMQDYGWALLAVAGLFIVSLYLWSYLSKHFQKMKAKEGKYLDSDVIGFLDHVVKAFILIILIFSALYVASIVSEAFRENVWNHILGYLIEIIFIIAIVLIAMLIVRILRRIAKRARVKATSQETLHTSAVEFTSLFLSYVVYVIVAVVVIVVFVSMIPGADPYSALIQFASDNVAAIMSTVVIIIAVYFVVKLIEAILEDYKFRTKKFTPQTIDLFKISIRYALYLMAVLTAIFSLLTLMGLGSVGLVLVIITFVFVVLGIALSYSTVRNIVSGIAIMDVNPF